jgi:hypothetical protein
VCVALVIQHAIRIFSASYYTAICGLSDSTLLLHVIYFYTPRVSGKNYWTETRVLIFSPNSVRNISHSKNNSGDIVTNVHKVPIILVGFSSNLNFSHMFSKKFHENTSSGGRVVAFGQTEGRTDRHDKTNDLFFQILRKGVKKTNSFSETDKESTTLIYISVLQPRAQNSRFT